MSAQNLSHQQLAMFMPAHEIAKLRFSDRRHFNESNEDVLARKLESAKTNAWAASKGMYKSIKKIGVQEPVEIVHGGPMGAMLTDGHHRVASAMDINPKMLIPVIHWDY